MHRDLHGEKNDHALVDCQWKWRIRTVKPKLAKDFNCLYDKKSVRKAFEAAVATKLRDLDYDVGDSTTEMYAKMCAAIHHAIATTLPDRERRSNIRRKVSDRTKRLFEQRQLLRGKGNKQQFDKIQADIKASSLDDFKEWVGEWAELEPDLRCGQVRTLPHT